MNLRLLATLFLASGAVLGLFASEHAYFPGDLALAREIQTWTFSHHLMWFLSWLGADWIPYVYVIVTGLLFHSLKQHRWAAIIWIGVGGSALMNRIIKMLIARSRPPDRLLEILIEYPNESFPSGHVVLFSTYFGFLAYLAARSNLSSSVKTAVLIGCGLLVLLVGPSRVYVGAHWPSDVLGGYLFGSAWLCLMILLNHRMSTDR